LSEVTKVYEEGEIDFMEDRLFHGRKIRVIMIDDRFSLEGLALEIELSLLSERIVYEIDTIASERGHLKRLRVDNGSELTRIAMLRWSVKRSGHQNFIDPRKPQKNAWIESLNARFPWLTYAFDYADRPNSVSGTYSGSPATYVSSTTYAPFGPRLSSVFGNGTTQTFSYNQRYLLTANKLVKGSTTLSNLTYAENNTGYVTSVTDAVSAAYDRTYTYGGNATNMITTATTRSSLWGTARYADAYAQNLTQALFPSRMLAFKLAQINAQLQSVFNQGTGTSTAVSFDAAGTYSPRNLLASGDGIAYVYDGFGQRVSATTTISGSSKTETSLYDPSRHLQTETSLSNGSIAFDYVWFAGVPVAEEDIAGSHTYWTAVDHLGAPIILTNSSGAIAWQADYEPFGAIYQVRVGSTIHQPLRFPGQEAELFDGSQGVNGFSARLYNGMRWYRPQWGRYTQADPLGYAWNPYNIYGYVGNNPINDTDPIGLAFQLLVAGGAAVMAPGSGGSLNAGVGLNL
jgi:RHS repeat-associated protein